MLKLKNLVSSSTNKPILLDGGMGSMIEDSGVNVKTALWGSYAILSEEGRVINREIHQNYVDAGAVIIQANTHNALLHNCRNFLDSNTIDHKFTDIDPRGTIEKQSVELHKFIIRCAIEDARIKNSNSNSVLVANCIGSIDLPYATVGSVSASKVAQVFEIEIQARWEISKDLIIFETLTTREEIDGLAITLNNVSIDNFAIGLTCGEDGKTYGGVSMTEAVEKLSPFNPQAYFIQCTRYDYVDKALIELIASVYSDVPIGVYANDGRGWDSHKMEWTGDRVTPAVYAEYAKRWHELGARIIGGCCGTCPEHIADLHKLFVI